MTLDIQRNKNTKRLAEQIGSASRLFYLSPVVLFSKIFVYDDVGILHVHYAITVDIALRLPMYHL